MGRDPRQPSDAGPLPGKTFARLRAAARVRTYRDGQAIFLKGDDASAGMMAVDSGRVRIVSNSADGKEVILRVIGPGEIFGEIAMLDGGTRTADAVAMGDAEILHVRQADFLAFLEDNPRLCIDLLKLVCQRLRSTSEQLEDFSFLDLRTRLAKGLLHLASEHGRPVDGGGPIDIAISQQTLAAMMGTSREAVNRQLRLWQDEGLVALRRNTVTVLDSPALQGLVGEA